MGTGSKIFLIGCVVVLVVCGIAIVGGGWFVKNWFSEKAKTVENLAGSKDSEYGKKSAELRKEYPFTPPANNLITEDQFNRFISVRKAMYGVYQRNEAQFKEMEKNKESGLSGALKGLELLNDIRKAQIEALEQQRMSPDEYTYVVTAVYKTWFAKGAREALKDQGTATQAAAENLKKSIAEIDKQLQDPNTPEEAKKQLEATKQQLETQLQSIPQNTELKQIDNELASIPKENIDLFSRHEAEIKQYSMSGLELIGL